MKNFKALKNVALIFEILAYLNLLTIGVVLIVYIIGKSARLNYFGNSFDNSFLEMGLGALITLFIGLFYYLLPMSIANLLRLQIDKYETSFTNLEVSREILSELKSGSANGNNLKELEFKAWKINNPNKSINDFFAEKNS